MPTFVIHELNKPPMKTTRNEREIRVGRDTGSSHIVLPGATVSRDHAVFCQLNDGRWAVRCTSETNPIVVDGALTSANAFLSEGSEVFIGSEYLIIFSLDEYKATSYMGDKGYFSKCECSKCHWKGMVSTLRRQPVCPRCCGAELISETEYRRDTASSLAVQGRTVHTDAKQIKEMLGKIKAAKRSRIERVDGRDDGPTRRDLSETAPLAIGKSERAGLKLHGFTWGSGVTIAWDGSAFTAKSGMVFPGLKINGLSRKEARLSDGDLLEVGSNRFKFVTE